MPVSSYLKNATCAFAVAALDRARPDEKTLDNWRKHARIMSSWASLCVMFSFETLTAWFTENQRISSLGSNSRFPGEFPFEMTRAADYLEAAADDTVPRAPLLDISRQLFVTFGFKALCLAKNFLLPQGDAGARAGDGSRRAWCGSSACGCQLGAGAMARIICQVMSVPRWRSYPTIVNLT